MSRTLADRYPAPISNSAAPALGEKIEANTRNVTARGLATPAREPYRVETGLAAIRPRRRILHSSGTRADTLRGMNTRIPQKPRSLCHVSLTLSGRTGKCGFRTRKILVPCAGSVGSIHEKCWFPYREVLVPVPGSHGRCRAPAFLGLTAVWQTRLDALCDGRVLRGARQTETRIWQPTYNRKPARRWT